MTTLVTVNTFILKNWIKRHKFGVELLTIRAQVSSTIIRKAMGGTAPEAAWVRKQLAEAMEVSESDLFPSIGAQKEAA